MPQEKLRDRARDELFSHINRCGVLQASPDDQKVWMDETIEYIGERYPDLTDGDLRELYGIGIRFCKPAIPHGLDGPDVVPQAVDSAADGAPAGADENTAKIESDANAA